MAKDPDTKAKAALERADGSLRSMTGFARVEGEHGGARWVWEIKSVNGRSLDVRVRLPGGHDALEASARSLSAARFGRGSISINVALKRAERTPTVQLNEAVLEQLLGVLGMLRERMTAPPANAEALLALPGVLDITDEEEDETDREARLAAMTDTLARALDALAHSRGEEGGRLERVMADLLGEIEALTAKASEIAAAQPEKFRARVDEQLAELLGADPPLSEDRLVQEVAHLAARADVREEIDRLGAHISAARGLMSEGGLVGRKLDFLCQEFNREANTLCSKSSDLELTRIGLDLKASIERFREQVQNIE